MRRFTHLHQFALLLLVCVTLAGCQNYREDSGRTIGEFTDDVGIAAAVKRALIADAEIKGLRVNVDVHRGVVSVRGRVPSDYARQKVLAVAAQSRGVQRVVDQLTVVP